MNKSPFELINRGEIAVVVKQHAGKANWYPYQDIFEIIEVDAQLDHDTLKIKSYPNSGEQWTYRLLRNMDDSLANWQSRDRAIQLTSLKGIEAAEKQVLKNLRNLRKFVKEAQKNPVWLELKKIADEKIRLYQSDFYYWDAKTLFEFSDEKFLWFVRETGTHLIIFKSEYGKSIIKAEKIEKNCDIFYWNGKDLKQVDVDRAEEVFKTFKEFTLNDAKENS